MASPFSRTLRSLEADTFRRGLVMMGVGFALLGAWGLWLCTAKLSVYAVSQTARLEVMQAAFPVVAVAGGRVAAMPHQVGDTVSTGEVVLELDSEEPMLAVDEARAREDALSTRLDALRGALVATEAAVVADAASWRSQIAEARAALAEAEAAAIFAEAEADRDTQLAGGGAVAAAELEAALALAHGRRAAAEAAAAALARAEEGAEQAARTNEATLTGLRGEIDVLTADLSASNAGVSKAELSVERTQLRAPVDGVLGELAPLQIGVLVDAGAVLATVVPDGRLHVVAWFLPADALGHIEVGQRARMRLDGFPWTQFGSVDATVEAVAQEPRDGLVRVDLAVAPDPDSSLPLHHALTGTVEIVLERRTPAVLALRAAGRLLSRPAAEP